MLTLIININIFQLSNAFFTTVYVKLYYILYLQRESSFVTNARFFGLIRASKTSRQ